jgi:tRNA-specific 2-thiouridylase
MRLAVAMSGGVDSTTAALLLKDQGHEVIGLHMRLHPHAERSWGAAQRAAAELSVPIHQVDLVKQFRELVLEPFIHEYTHGRTPSPCPLCNQRVKIGLLFPAAQSFGCQKLATGHYARIEHGSEGPVLLKGTDRAKDQSYFLFMLTREMLGRVIFPLGGLTKRAVKNLAAQRGITAAGSDESQELCFISGGDYKAFLYNEGVESRRGTIVNVAGEVLGEHKGIVHFTVGQRRGIGICAPKPLYVIRIDSETDQVMVGTREDALAANVRMSRINVLRDGPIRPGESFHVKVRSNARAVPGAVVAATDRTLELRFDELQSGVAPGQAAVLYSGDRVAAGGWIEGHGPSQ